MARHNSSPRIGFVSIDGHDHWPGGRYYLQHIIRALALLPEGERPSMRDVWWRERDATDKSFDNVRDVMSAPVVVKPPTGAFARLMRRFSRDGNRRKDFGDLFRAADVDILFPTSACERPGVPLLYWLPDFQHKRRPDLNPAPLADWFDQNFQRMTEAAEFVLLSSRDALSDFKRYFPQFAHKGRALSAPSLPQPDWYECDPAKTARRLGLSERYFMICNQYTAHKNHLTVFEAVRRLKARGEDVQIVCTGHPVDYKAQDFGARLSRFIADNGLEQNIRLLGFLPRSEQMALLRGATSIVQPSLFEGWSTPAEDALSLGRPAILSDIAVHREKLPRLSATLVAAEDVEAWASALLVARDNPVEISSAMEESARKAAELRGLAFARAFVALTVEAAEQFERRAAA